MFDSGCVLLGSTEEVAFLNVLCDTSIWSYALVAVGEQSGSLGSLLPLEKRGTGAQRMRVT